MITVSVYLDSAITKRRSELARVLIANTGTSADPKRGDYHVVVLRGRSTEQLDKMTVQKRASVEGHPRESEHVLNLVTKALAAAGYKTA